MLLLGEPQGYTFGGAEPTVCVTACRSLAPKRRSPISPGRTSGNLSTLQRVVWSLARPQRQTQSRVAAETGIRRRALPGRFETKSADQNTSLGGASITQRPVIDLMCISACTPPLRPDNRL